jgi:hypothetical protein
LHWFKLKKKVGAVRPAGRTAFFRTASRLPYRFTTFRYAGKIVKRKGGAVIQNNLALGKEYLRDTIRLLSNLQYVMKKYEENTMIFIYIC